MESSSFVSISPRISFMRSPSEEAIETESGDLFRLNRGDETGVSESAEERPMEEGLSALGFTDGSAFFSGAFA